MSKIILLIFSVLRGGRRFAKNRFFLKKMFYRFVAESLRNGKIRSVFFYRVCK